MRWIVIVLLGLAAIVAIVAAVGSMLPRQHAASRTLATRRSPAEIWALVSDPAFAKAATGQEVPVETVESVAPVRLVSRIADPDLPYGGTWTYAIRADANGATLTITEDGFVSNVVFRFVSRFIIGHHGAIDAYLKGVAKRFSEDPALSGE